MFSIETPRITLRDLQESDISDLFLLGSDKKVTRYLDYIRFDSEEDTRNWTLDMIRHNASNPRHSYNLAIVRKSDDVFVGWIGIGEPNDATLGDLDFGFALLPKHWGNGYATEALRALLDYCFTTLHVQKIIGDCDTRNLGSRKVMEKVGMREEATYDDIDSRTEEKKKQIRYGVTNENGFPPPPFGD